MAKVTYKYESDTGLTSFYINGEYLTMWDCGEVEPEDVFKDFMKIFNAGQGAAFSEIVFTIDDAISLASFQSDRYSQEDIDLIMHDLQCIKKAILPSKINQILNKEI